jgi:hypothetical protein
LTSNIILLYKDRAPCGKLPLHKTSAGESDLRKALGQMDTALDKGRDWVGSITQVPGHLEPELRHSPQPVEGVAALLVMGKMQIVQKMGEKVIFWANSK